MPRYSDDLRRGVIAGARESHELHSHVARTFGIAPATLNNWLSKFYAENPQELEADHQRLADEQARLLSKQEALRMQLPWLRSLRHPSSPFVLSAPVRVAVVHTRKASHPKLTDK